MYDRSTNTLWHQFLGEPAVGPLADSGIKLELLPALTTTWGEWLAAHPDTTVLDIDTGIYQPDRYRPEDDNRSVYFGYRQRNDTMFPAPHRSDLLPTKDQVLGLNLNGQARAYPLDTLRAEPVVNDALGGTTLVVVTIVEAGAARAYERGAHQFSPAKPRENGQGIVELLDERGRRWKVDEDAIVLIEDPGQRLPRLPSHTAYWFGWYSFHPATDIYGQGQPKP